MKIRFSAIAFVAVLGLTAAAPAMSQASICEFDDIVIFATNSVRIGTNSIVARGHVVANDASPGPVLDEGVEVALDRNAAVAETVKADSVDLDNGASAGMLECNDGDPTCTGLALPVFDQLPPFQEAQVRPDCEDVLVGPDETEILGDENPRETCYGDIVLDRGATVLFSGGGGFDVRSIDTVSTVGGQCPFPCRSILFDAPTDLRIEGRFHSDRNSLVGGVGASEVVIYVDGINGDGGSLLEEPRAASVGRGSAVEASFYVPNGRFELERESTATGAFLGRDVSIDKDSTVDLESAFVNGAPTADSKTVFTDGSTSIDITLTASDFEGGDLVFAVDDSSLVSGAITAGPTPIIPDPVGRCSITGASCSDDEDCTEPGEICEDIQISEITAANVTYTPFDPSANLKDFFDYTATDECSDASDPATVDINPPGDPTDPPNDPIATVDASDVFAETTTNTSVTIGLEASPPGFCSVSGTVCSDLEDGDPQTTNSTDCPLNQDGDPQTSELCEADPLTFSIESLPSGSLTDPVLGDVGPPLPFDLSGSSVIYSPVTDFTSGICTISGDLCEVSDDCLPDGGACIPPDSFTFGATGVQGGSDTATVSVSVFAPEELAEDLEVSTGLNTPVQITLLANPGGTGNGGNPFQGPAPPAGVTQTTPGSASSISSSGLDAAEVEAAGLVPPRAPTSFRIDFGVTPDDFGNANPCGFISITTQYVETQSIVFGTAVSTPSPPLPVTVPNVVIVNDGAANPPCRSSGEPVFTGDWWAQFRAGTAPGVAGDLAGVNSFSVEVGFINNPGDGIPDLIAYDIDGTVLDFVWTSATGGPFQVLTVSDPAGEKRIAFVHVNSSDDLAGLGMDFLDYDEPAPLGTALGLTWTVASLPPANEGTLTTLDGSAVTLGQTFTEEPTVVFTPTLNFSGSTSFTYDVTEGLVTDSAIVDILVSATDECVLVGRDPGCSTGGAGAGAGGSGGGSGAGGSGADGGSGNMAIDGPVLRVSVLGDAMGSVSSSRRELGDGDSLHGLACDGDCAMSFMEGSLVVLFARPIEADSEFVSWGGDCSGSDPMTTIDLRGDRQCSAEFAKVDE